jgi:hypothetical protein
MLNLYVINMGYPLSLKPHGQSVLVVPLPSHTQPGNTRIPAHSPRPQVYMLMQDIAYSAGGHQKQPFIIQKLFHPNVK